MSILQDVRARVDALELDFNELGIDRYGVSKRHLVVFFSALLALYRYYFRVKVFGIEHVPSKGRAVLVGNHSGGVAIDGAMVVTSTLMEMDPPRLAQGMAEKFLNRMPISSLWTARLGHFTGLPENAQRLLDDDRLLMVFPEGARGTAKLYSERYSLVEFGTGFVRLAMKTKSPVIPFAVLGGGAAFPTIFNSKTLGRLIGAPYVPFTAYLLPIPLPAPMEVHYGPPMMFEGTGDEEDAVVAAHVERVKETVAAMIASARTERRGRLRA